MRAVLDAGAKVTLSSDDGPKWNALMANINSPKSFYNSQRDIAADRDYWVEIALDHPMEVS